MEICFSAKTVINGFYYKTYYEMPAKKVKLILSKPVILANPFSH